MNRHLLRAALTLAAAPVFAQDSRVYNANISESEVISAQQALPRY